MSNPHPYVGTLSIGLACDRPFRGELVSILTHIANGDPIGHRARAAVRRLNAAVAEAPWSRPVQAYCPGHPCEDDAAAHPHAGIGELYYCDGSCQRAEVTS